MITHKIKFIDSCRFMQSTLSDLADTLPEINNKDCKKCMEEKKLWKDACPKSMERIWNKKFG